MANPAQTVVQEEIAKDSSPKKSLVVAKQTASLALSKKVKEEPQKTALEHKSLLEINPEETQASQLLPPLKGEKTALQHKSLLELEPEEGEVDKALPKDNIDANQGTAKEENLDTLFQKSTLVLGKNNVDKNLAGGTEDNFKNIDKIQLDESVFSGNIDKESEQEENKAVELAETSKDFEPKLADEQAKEQEVPKEQEEIKESISSVTVTPLINTEQSLFSKAFNDDLPSTTSSNKSLNEEKTIFSRAFADEDEHHEEISKVGLIKQPANVEKDLNIKSPFFDQDKEFMSRVDEAWFDRGSQKAKYMIITFSALMVFFVVWAAYASIDEVARGQGQVIPSQRVQLIQHLEGGILSEVLVREGETVEPDQILARVDNVSAESLLRDTEAQILETTLALIRLEAELNNVELVFPEEYNITAPEIVAAQEQTYNSRKSQQASSREILLKQKEQKEQALNEAETRKDSYMQGFNLVQKRVDLARPLVVRKLYAEVDFLNLQQEAVRLQGDIDATENSIAKVRAEIAEIDERVDLSRREFESEIIKEINTLRTELASLRENQTASTDKVTRTELRSQVRGIVNRILLNTKGGVVKPGENIMEVVPLDDSLVIETKVRPQDIAFISPNQKAVVRITAYDSSIYGSMDGFVEQIGADTVTDEKGDIFFLVKVRTNENAIYHNEEILPITPGMVATVDILTGKKTILDYLLKPITKASQYALKER